jgi:hypothetical protein
MVQPEPRIGDHRYASIGDEDPVDSFGGWLQTLGLLTLVIAILGALLVAFAGLGVVAAIELLVVAPLGAVLLVLRRLAHQRSTSSEEPREEPSIR